MAIVKRCLFLLLFPAICQAANLTGSWFSTSQKTARQDLWPKGSCSSCAITTNWDGKRAYMFGGKGEILHGVAYLQDNSGSDATNVNIRISSFTDNAGHWITPLTVSSTSVNDSNAAGPIQLFYYQYLQITGLSQLSYDVTEIDERDLPPNLRVPCVVTVGGAEDGRCPPTAVTNLWWNRRDHDKFYPEIALPYESIAASSFTVAASSSQAIGIDIYIATNTYIGSGQTYNVFHGTMSVYEGVTLSTAIPIDLKVYSFTMPTRPRLPFLATIGESHLNYFHYNSSGTVIVGGPRQTTRENYYKYLWRNRMIPVGDDVSKQAGNPARDWPSDEYHKQLTGELFTNANGFGNSPQVSTGVPFYMNGEYVNWRNDTYFSSTTMTGGSGAFCSNVSSWSVNMARYPGVRSALYLYDEPADSQTVVGTVERLANAMTNTCSMPGSLINSWVTDTWVNELSSAPHVNMPATVIWSVFSHNQTDWPPAAANYQTTGATQAWAYNGESPAIGYFGDTGETGPAAMTFGPAAFKKGVQGWFMWEFVNWDNPNNSPNVVDDLWNDAKTFGGEVTYASFSVTGMAVVPSCDYTDNNGQQYAISFTTAGKNFLTGTSPTIGGWMILIATNSTYSGWSPAAPSGTLTKVAGTVSGSPSACSGDATISYSTWTKTLVHPQRGRNGYTHGLGDGVLLYPGHNRQDAAHDYGIDGPIGSFRLKMIRNGLNLYDYSSMAYSVNPTSATSIISAMVPTILYEMQPVQGHGYYFTGRQWSDEPQVWESNRELLAQWIAAGSSSTITSALTTSGTNGLSFSYQITADNNPQTFTATGLPTGLSLDSDTGLISGIVTGNNYGDFNVTLTATNALGAGPSSTLVMTINRITLPWHMRFRQ